jgi:hypothetical protein
MNSHGTSLGHLWVIYGTSMGEVLESVNLLPGLSAEELRSLKVWNNFMKEFFFN